MSDLDGERGAGNNIRGSVGGGSRRDPPSDSDRRAVVHVRKEGAYQPPKRGTVIRNIVNDIACSFSASNNN